MRHSLFAPQRRKARRLTRSLALVRMCTRKSVLQNPLDDRVRLHPDRSASARTAAFRPVRRAHPRVVIPVTGNADVP